MGFARNTQVLTSNGWTAIADLEDDYQVYTGNGWALHGGLLCSEDAVDPVKLYGVFCEGSQEFLEQPSTYLERLVKMRITADTLAIQPASVRDRLFRKNRVYTPSHYRCRLQAGRPKPTDLKMFDIDSVPSYLILTTQGPLLTVAFMETAK